MLLGWDWGLKEKAVRPKSNKEVWGRSSGG